MSGYSIIRQARFSLVEIMIRSRCMQRGIQANVSRKTSFRNETCKQCGKFLRPLSTKAITVLGQSNLARFVGPQLVPPLEFSLKNVVVLNPPSIQPLITNRAL